MFRQRKAAIIRTRVSENAGSESLSYESSSAKYKTAEL